METTLGKRIASGRRKLGLTQDKLAEQLGVTAQAVSKWENDQSCPDLNMLPKLAEIFGTTTDALLGMETVHEAEVVEPRKVREEDEKEGIHIDAGDVDIQWKAGRRGSLWFALWVVLFGGLLAASTVMHRDIGWWSLCWPSFILVLGLSELIRKFSFMGLGFTLFGGYFLLGNFMVIPFAKGLVMPVLIVLFGLSLLVDALRKPKKSRFVVCNGSSPKEKSSFTTENGFFNYDISFGGRSQMVELPRLAGGEANVSFGELTVDITRCEEIAPDCRLELNCSFGELELRLPKTCRAELRDSTSFANVEIKGRPDEDAPDRIFLDCSASFGEIGIIYV